MVMMMNHFNKFLFLFFSLISSFSSIPISLAVTCPMDLSYVLTIPWDTFSCQNYATNSSSSPEIDPCCNTLLSLYEIAFAQRLKETNFFMLPDLDTSVSCLQSFQSKLEVFDLPTNISSFCFAPHQFVISENTCASIKNSTDFVSRLEGSPTLTELNSSCRSNLRDHSNCTSCVTSTYLVKDALLALNGEDDSESLARECYLFAILYAAGIINSLDPSNRVVLTYILSIPMNTPEKSRWQAQRRIGQSRWQLKIRIGVRGLSLKKKFVIAGAVGGTFVLTLVAFVFVICIRKRMIRKRQSKRHQEMESLIRNYGSSVPKRFKYSEVKKMTKSFKKKLGQGGFGAVYKGKLRNGTLVAVKLLHELKGNGEDFINEVASISRTSHVNIVTLLGFCFEGSKRALIYEYMPNQSLDKYICGESPERHLGWEKLHQIAVGVARGLEYLHRGCNTRILHFDIKPQNILLDDAFRPKISDFGLSKLCLKEESILSTLTTRGTIGYIAPEVFSRNFGGVSHKSDVYSYGMMLIDMVGGRMKLDEAEDRSSQIYFPDRVYRLLERDHDFGLHNPISPEENEIARKMVAVGIWCIQTVPSERPSISRVIELLEGNIQPMQMPPKPYLFSAPTQATLDSSFASESS